MTSEILIGIGGLILAGLTYFAGVRRTEKRLSKAERSDRIQKVFDKYMQFRRTNYTGGLDGLQKSGVAMLQSDAEIRELIDLIIKHAETNPLGNPKLFDSVDLKTFFDYAAIERINFLRTKIEDVIEKTKARV